MDASKGPIGKVTGGVNDSTSQAILLVAQGDKEILIPITDAILTKVDRENKTVHIDAPEGLIDLYLE